MSRAPEPAFVIPDVAAWMMRGHDPLGTRLSRAAAPEQAGVLVLPETVPLELADAVRESWERMPEPRRSVLLENGYAGEPAQAVLDGGHAGGHADDDAHHDDHGGHDHDAHDHHGHDHDAHDHHGHDHEAHDHGGHDHGEHDHHDMMAIVGDPSDDGLIMESLDFLLGPLAPSLPGGLVVELSLDGDVVAHAHARATLGLRPDDPLGDPLTALSWRAATERARRRPSEAAARRQMIAVETERALSHSLNLHGLGFALGWRDLADAAFDLARALLPARAAAETSSVVDDLRGVERPLAAIRRIAGSRGMRRRLGGRAVVEAADVDAHKIGGPIARAAGVEADDRATDPLYRALDFEPAVVSGGDAAARVAVRVAEIAGSVALVRRAAADSGEEQVDDADPTGLPIVVEGPRGPLLAVASPEGSVAVATPGAAGALQVAGEAVVGLEFGPAVAALVSFDLSPWRVDG